ncbi:uncharacterized protein LOC131995821 [Stomoxys calcitrans]|uniref:uncharacterized protein LOC131995821 n=1 Tax=Stomoxys calcitrans TaxID=35570 RepID=UPI0027E2BCBA|nr:uncharacterized protein LOC131995821 [Stomoxys calcitrans]
MATNANCKIKVFKSVETSFNKDYISQLLVNISQDHTTFDSEVVYIKKIISSYFIKLVVDVMIPKTGDYRTLFNYEANICDILGTKGSQTINLFSIWIQNIFKYSDMPKSCPIQKVCFINGCYGWRGFKVDRNSIPPFVVNGLYRITANNTLKYKDGDIQVVSAVLMVEIKMK